MRQRLLAALLVVGLALAATPAGASVGPELGSQPGSGLQSDATARVAATGSDAQTSCSFPVTSTDATGTEVTVTEEPQRVTVLAPSAAQTMWDIGAREKVVGAPVTQYTSYLEGIGSRQNVAASGEEWVDTEAVVNTTPDLVLAPNVISNETVGTLRDAGLTVYRFEAAHDLEDIYAKTRLTGRLVGSCAGADETVTWMRERISTVRAATEGEPKPPVFFSLGAGWTAGRQTFVDEMLTVAGAQNVAARANVTGYARMSEEAVVEQNPQWIVENGEYGDYPKTEAFNSTDAVQNGRVFTVNSDYVSQAGPRVVYPIVAMAKHFHPEAWRAANATTTDAATATTIGQTTTATATTTATTSESSSGFGIGAALAALLGALALARRR